MADQSKRDGTLSDAPAKDASLAADATQSGADTFLAPLDGYSVDAGPRRIKLVAMCRGAVVTSPPRMVSFVFSAADYHGNPVADLDADIANNRDGYKLDDGGNVTGLESQSLALSRPQSVGASVLLLLDGSGSLTGLEETIRASAKSLVASLFEEQTYKEVAVYKFFGGKEPQPIADFSSDGSAIVKRIEQDTKLTDPNASTALYSAIQTSIALLSQHELPAKYTYRTKALVIFTDGFDEVTSGQGYETARSLTVATAQAFLQQQDINGANLIYSIGLSHTLLPDGGGSSVDAGTNVDDKLLVSVSTNDGYSSVDTTNIVSKFRDVAYAVNQQSKRFYQFNLCTNRRIGGVTATLTIATPQYSSDGLTFAYSADGLTDGPCDPKADGIPTCNWSIALPPLLCQPQQTACGTACVNVNSNISNCGACGHACDFNATCANGICQCPGAYPWLCEVQDGSLCFNGTAPPDCSTIIQCQDKMLACPSGFAANCSSGNCL